MKTNNSIILILLVITSGITKVNAQNNSITIGYMKNQPTEINKQNIIEDSILNKAEFSKAQEKKQQHQKIEEDKPNNLADSNRKRVVYLGHIKTNLRLRRINIILPPCLFYIASLKFENHDVYI